jgi:hypothetical protein
VPSAPAPAPPATVVTVAPKPVAVSFSAPATGSVAAGVAKLTVRNTGKVTVSGTVTLKGRASGRTVTFGKVSFSVGAGKRETVRITLAPSAVKALRGHTRFTVSATYALLNATGGTLTLHKSVRLTVPKTKK